MAQESRRGGQMSIAGLGGRGVARGPTADPAPGWRCELGTDSDKSPIGPSFRTGDDLREIRTAPGRMRQDAVRVPPSQHAGATRLLTLIQRGRAKSLRPEGS